MLPITLQDLPPLIRLQKLKELQQKITGRVKAVERNLHSIEIQEKQELLEIEAMIDQSTKEIDIQQDNPFGEPLSSDEFNHEQTKANTLTVNLTPQPQTKTKEKETSKNKQSKNIAPQTLEQISATANLATTPLPPSNPFSQTNNPNYSPSLREQPSLYLRNNIEQLYTQIQTRGYLLWEQHELAQNIASALENKVQDLQSGNYIPSDPSTTQEHIDVTQKIAQSILGMQPALNQPQQKDWYKGT